MPSASPPFLLEQFTPLLAQKGAAALRRLADDEQFAEAARELERRLKEKKAPFVEDAGWLYLLGKFTEEAGDAKAAGAAYRRAAELSTPLEDYCHLAAGRVALRQGQYNMALQDLALVSNETVVSASARLLEADAHVLNKHPDAAITLWRDHLAEGGIDRVGVSLRLARALKDRAERQAAADIAHPEVAVVDDLTEAIDLAVAVSRIATTDSARQASLDLLAALQKSLPKGVERKAREPQVTERRESVARLVDLRDNDAAIEAADSLLAQLGKADGFSEEACEVRLLRAKAMSQARKWGEAADYLSDVLRLCEAGEDFRARALFLAGKYSASDARHMQAVERFEKLEREVPTHRLADDARLRAAKSYLAAGVEARFTELLAKMPSDYPDGDMVMDGIFALAVRRIEKSDWSGAVSVLESTLQLPRASDTSRGQEYSGREQYFLARSRQMLGQEAEALDAYEDIIGAFPLSYYMLHAYSRLRSTDRKRAEDAVRRAMQRSESQPFSFQARPEHAAPQFVRAVELLRVGEVQWAERELRELGVHTQSAQAELLWGVALLYSRAGAERLAHQMTRDVLSGFLEHWPSGDWAKAWQLAFPRPYLKLAQREAEKQSVAEAWIYGVMREESAFDPGAESPASAYGLMQLIVPTARHYAKRLSLPYDRRSLKVPRVNIALGTSVLADLQQRFSDNPLLAIPGYNAGPGRPARWRRERSHADFDVWVELIPFTETRRYTKRVLASRATYAALYASETADAAMTLPLTVAGDQASP